MCRAPCPGQRHGPWLLLPQGSRSSQRDEPYTERTLDSAGGICCPLEAVREAPGGSWSEGLDLQVVFWGLSGFHEPIAAMHLGKAGLFPGALSFSVL